MNYRMSSPVCILVCVGKHQIYISILCDQRILVEKLPTSLESHLPVDDHPFFQILLTGLVK